MLSNRSSICLNWTRPFSLDITGVDPDFWYCVEVYNITWGRAPLSTNCSVYETQFCFTAPNPSPCHLFEFRVFAVNQVGNGSVASVNGTFFEGIITVYFSTVTQVCCLQCLKKARVPTFCSCQRINCKLCCKFYQQIFSWLTYFFIATFSSIVLGSDYCDTLPPLVQRCCMIDLFNST